MDFAMSPRAAELQERLQTFVDECITPATPTYWSQIEESGDIRHHPAIMEDRKSTRLNSSHSQQSRMPSSA